MIAVGGDGAVGAAQPAATMNGIQARRTTAATYTALPRGLYTVMLDGVTSVLLRNDGSAAAEPASGASGTGGGHQSGWTYEHNISAGTGDLSAIVLNSGSGRLYLIRQP